MSLYDILKSAKIGAAPDMLTKLRAQIAPFAKGGYTEKELEAVPPLSFIANGQSLLDWSIDGASGGVGDRTDNLAETVQGGIDATNGLDGTNQWNVIQSRMMLLLYHTQAINNQ